jgi:hypothetical protein
MICFIARDRQCMINTDEDVQKNMPLKSGYVFMIESSQWESNPFKITAYSHDSEHITN